MSDAPRIVSFAGSLREASFNKKLAAIVARGAERAGAEVEVLDLRDFRMPIYDQDLEDREGLPGSVLRFKKSLIGADGLVIASPEYNGSITGVLKNALDWASRPAPDEKPLAAFKGKVAGLVSASPGALGGLRALVHVRAILGNLGMLVIPDQVAIPQAFQAFGENDDLVDEKLRAKAMAVGETVADFAGRLRSS